MAPMLVELPPLLEDDWLVDGVGAASAEALVDELEPVLLVEADVLDDVVVGIVAARKYCPEKADASQLNSVNTLPGEAVVDQRYVRQ